MLLFVELFYYIANISIDAVITDPPYTDERAYTKFFRVLIPKLHRVLKKDAWLVFYWPTAKLDVPFRLSILNYFEYRDSLVILYKRPTSSFSLIGRKQTILCMLFSKGNPKIYLKPGDIILGEEDPDIVPEIIKPDKNRPKDWRPTFATKLILAMLTKEGDTVLDPMCGYGTIPAMCELMDRKWIAADINKGRVEFAKTLIERVVQKKKNRINYSEKQ